MAEDHGELILDLRALADGNHMHGFDDYDDDCSICTSPLRAADAIEALVKERDESRRLFTKALMAVLSLVRQAGDAILREDESNARAQAAEAALEVAEGALELTAHLFGLCYCGDPGCLPCRASTALAHIRKLKETEDG